MLGFLLALLTAQQEPDVVGKLKLCAALQESLKRLDCYDGLVKSLAPSGTEEKEPARPGKWEVETSKNPLDDSTIATATIVSDERNAAMVVRCKQKKTDLFINWGQFLGSDPPRVTTRIDSLKADTGPWSISNDNRAAFHYKPEAFAKMLRGGTRLVVQVTPYRESPVTSTFDLTGIAEVLQPIATTCAWK